MMTYKLEIKELVEQMKYDEKKYLYDVPEYYDNYAKKLLKIVNNDITKYIDFLDNDCTPEDLYYLSEFFPEVAGLTGSREFVECLYRFNDKFPKEAKELKLYLAIEDAEDELEYFEERIKNES